MNKKNKTIWETRIKGKTAKTSKADGEPANSVELQIILPKRAKA